MGDPSSCDMWRDDLNLWITVAHKRSPILHMEHVAPLRYNALNGNDRLKATAEGR
jgi:hypothetical protein